MDHVAVLQAPNNVIKAITGLALFAVFSCIILRTFITWPIAPFLDNFHSFEELKLILPLIIYQTQLPFIKIDYFLFHSLVIISF